jgi:predicted anti-sigma-YlaC factor YlaD
MIAHLSSEQLAECVLGLPSPMVARHVQDCPACRAELVQVREALGGFRGAVRVWSEVQANQALAISGPIPQSRSWVVSPQLAWALLIAVVFVIASFVTPLQRGESTAGADAVLLNQVDAQVSRTAPSSMEPLMKLVVQE